MIGLTKDERTLVVIRKHWLPVAVQGIVLFFGALLPFLVVAFVPSEVFLPFTSYAGADFVSMFFYFLWLLILWVVFFICWTNYYFDVWVLTNERIIDIDQVRLFHRQMVSARLEQIQDAHVEVAGVLQTFFGYGKLVLYTAGEHPDIVIENASHPYRAKEAVLAANKGAVTGAARPEAL